MGLIIPNLNSGYNKFGGGYFRDLNGNINKIGGMYYSDGKGNATKIFSSNLPAGTILYQPSSPLFLVYGLPEDNINLDGSASASKIKFDQTIQLTYPLNRVKSGITINFTNKILSYDGPSGNAVASTQFSEIDFYKNKNYPSVNISKDKLSGNIVLMHPQTYVNNGYPSNSYFDLSAFYDPENYQLRLLKNAFSSYSAIAEKNAFTIYAQIESIVSY